MAGLFWNIQAAKKRAREREDLANALRSTYEQPEAGFDPGTEEYDPGTAFPEMAGMGYKPGGVNIENALAQMYQGGGDMPVRALELQQALQAAQTKRMQAQGASAEPKKVQFLRYMENLSQSDPEAYKRAILALRSAPRALDIGTQYIQPDIVDPSITTPVSGGRKQLIEAEREKSLGSQSAKLAGEAFNQVGKIRGNISNLQQVIDLVGEGADTGPLSSKLPSFRSATVQLENVQKQLGLDVVGAVTFGALSKGELDLALSKALPLNLKGPELVKWTQDKINAQKKLADYFEAQSIYLSQPGSSPAGWLEKMKEERQKRGGVNVSPSDSGIKFLGFE